MNMTKGNFYIYYNGKKKYTHLAENKAHLALFNLFIVIDFQIFKAFTSSSRPVYKQ